MGKGKGFIGSSFFKILTRLGPYFQKTKTKAVSKSCEEQGVLPSSKFWVVYLCSSHMNHDKLNCRY
jgi:hypothetical protein